MQHETPQKPTMSATVLIYVVSLQKQNLLQETHPTQFFNSQGYAKRPEGRLLIRLERR